MYPNYGIFAILLALAVSVYCDYTLYVPSEKSIHWTPANHTSLRCPIRSAVHPVSGRVGTLPFLIPLHPNDNNVAGYSCHKAEWTSECTETWYWTTDVKQYIRYIEPTFEECKAAWVKKRDGLNPNPYFEAPTCQWANTVRKSHQFTMINLKQVKIDPYNLDFVDPIFPGGRCSNQDSCKTVQSGVIWHPQRKNPQQTEYAWKNVQASYGKSRKESDVYLIWGGGIPTTKFNNSCKMNFKGKTGIRFSSGFWAGVEPSTWHDSAFKKVYEDLPNCSEGTTIKVPSAHEEIAEHEMEIDDLILSLKCYDIIRAFEETGKISFLDLGFFNPDTEGPAHIYRIKEGKLEAASVNYQACQIHPKPHDPTRVICKDSKIKVLYDEWVPTGVSGILSGFNGVYKDRGVVKYAGYNLWNNKLTEADIQQMELEAVPHPSVLVIEKFAPGMNITLETTGERGEMDLDLLGGISSGWRKFWKYTTAFIISILLLYLIYFALKFFKILKTPRTERPETMQMQGFY
ncbi:glycoprotein [Charleville virus]|uniref:Glycoprotein n=1 Tax=Charleville virus TaxID=318842 RepID=A0A3S8TMP7_9RHAB|nr:glycoprotein [Charleville virus]AZL49338.1 glycoprotein [Charleville virus]